MAFAVPLKYIVLTNWFLACWAVWNPFLGTSYLFSNLTLFGLGIWAVIDKHGVDSFTAFMASYVYTVLTDFMSIGRYAKKDQITDSGDSDAKFALAMAAIGLIVKFAFLYFLWVEYNARGSAAVDGSHHQPLATGAYDPIAPQHQQPGGGVGGFQAQGSFVGAPQQHLPPVMGAAPQPIGVGVQPVAGGAVGASAGGFQSGQTGY